MRFEPNALERLLRAYPSEEMKTERVSTRVNNVRHDDAACLDIIHQALECRAIQMPAGDTTIIIEVGKQDPAFGLLAGDISRAGVALRIKRVELLIQPFFRTLPGVDGAADPLHGSTRCFAVSPKNRGPDQWAPVMYLAIADSDPQVLPSIW